MLWNQLCHVWVNWSKQQHQIQEVKEVSSDIHVLEIKTSAKNKILFIFRCNYKDNYIRTVNEDSSIQYMAHDSSSSQDWLPAIQMNITLT